MKAHEEVYERECKVHGLTDHIKEGLAEYFRCRKCRTANTSNRRRDRKQKAIEYKGRWCVACGLISRYNSVYDFHHRNPEEKLFEISKKSHSRSWEEVTAELDKCDILCANCHRIRHEQEREEVKETSNQLEFNYAE